MNPTIHRPGRLLPARLVAAAAFATLSLTALAQTPATPAAGAQGERAARMAEEFKKRFAAADANGDGKLSREEAAKMPFVSRNFDAIDSAHTGFVTAQQIGTYAMQQRGKRERPGDGAGKTP